MKYVTEEGSSRPCDDKNLENFYFTSKEIDVASLPEATSL
jgi:hypothetical protein